MLDKKPVHFKNPDIDLDDVKGSYNLEWLTDKYIEFKEVVIMSQMELEKPKLEHMSDEAYKVRLHKFKRRIMFAELFIDSIRQRCEYLNSDWLRGYNEAVDNIHVALDDDRVVEHFKTEIA